MFAKLPAKRASSPTACACGLAFTNDEYRLLLATSVDEQQDTTWRRDKCINGVLAANDACCRAFAMISSRSIVAELQLIQHAAAPAALDCVAPFL